MPFRRLKTHCMFCVCDINKTCITRMYDACAAAEQMYGACVPASVLCIRTSMGTAHTYQQVVGACAPCVRCRLFLMIVSNLRVQNIQPIYAIAKVLICTRFDTVCKHPILIPSFPTCMNFLCCLHFWKSIYGMLLFWQLSFCYQILPSR